MCNCWMGKTPKRPAQVGKLDEAGSLYAQSLAIREKILPHDHVDLASSFNNQARLLVSQGKLDEAEAPQQRAIDIWRKALGEEHPQVAKGLGHQAQLLQYKGEFLRSEQLHLRALAILEKDLGCAAAYHLPIPAPPTAAWLA